MDLIEEEPDGERDRRQQLCPVNRQIAEATLKSTHPLGKNREANEAERGIVAAKGVDPRDWLGTSALGAPVPRSRLLATNVPDLQKLKTPAGSRQGP